MSRALQLLPRALLAQRDVIARADVWAQTVDVGLDRWRAHMPDADWPPLQHFPDGPWERGHIRGYAERSMRDGRSVLALRLVFAASFVWVWGRRGVGRGGRFLAMATQDGRLRRALVDATNRLRDGEIGKAYDSLTIRGIGPAVATTYLSFASLGMADFDRRTGRPQRARPLILDSHIARALAHHAPETFAASTRAKWSPDAYERYTHTLATWADELAVEPDQLEYWLSQEGKALR